MKKILAFATILAVLVACNGKNDPIVKDNVQAENAGTVVFAAGNQPVVNKDGNSVLLSRINHFPNGDFVANGTVSGPAQTKNSLMKNLVGHFSVSDGVYTYSGDLSGATLTKKEGKVVFSKDGVTKDGNFTPSTLPSDATLKALSGAHWKLSYIEGKLKNKDVSVNFTDKDGINPNDVESMAKYLNGKGADIPMSKVEGCYIKSISLNVNPNAIIIEFVDPQKAPLEGAWTPDLLKKSFTYSLSAELDGKLFDGEASGTFELADNNNTLIIKMSAKASSDLAGDITIKAKKI